MAAAIGGGGTGTRGSWATTGDALFLRLRAEAASFAALAADARGGGSGSGGGLGKVKFSVTRSATGLGGATRPRLRPKIMAKAMPETSAAEITAALVRVVGEPPA